MRTFSWPLPMIPTVALLLALLGLGVWQIASAEHVMAQNRQWQKDRLLTAMEDLPPVEQSDQVKYRKVKLLGKFRHEKSVELPQSIDGRNGREIITPFAVISGEMLLVDRGFVAEDSHDAIDQPIGSVFVEGEMRPVLSDLDPNAVANDLTAEKLYPLMLVADAAPVNSKWPAPRKLTMPHDNPHWFYAGFWILLALTSGLFYFFSIREKED